MQESKPAIIFFDAFYSITEDRSLNNSGVKIINQLLTEMAGMEGLDEVIVLAATNCVERFDTALGRPGRFDNILYIGLSDNKSRSVQFEYYLKKEVSNLDFDKLFSITEGYSCTDIALVGRKVKEKMLDALINEEVTSIREEDVISIIKDTKRILSDAEIEHYNKISAS